MHADIDLALRALLLGDAPPVAALATLHRGEPATSMVPYALMPDSGDILLHISRLATHTQDLENDPRASLLVIAPPTAADTPLALPRVSLEGRAQLLEPGSAAALGAREVYLGRFPEAEMMTELPDIRYVLITPLQARQVAGFGAARSLDADELRALFGSAPELP